MFVFFRKNWIFALLILVVLFVGIFAMIILLKPDYLYLKLDDYTPDLKGAIVISNNIQIGQVSKEVQLNGLNGRLFQIQFDKTINIPENSEISIRKSNKGEDYTIFLKLVPSKNYLGNRDTLFVSSGNVAKDKPEPDYEQIKNNEIQIILSDETNDLQEPIPDQQKIAASKPERDLDKEKTDLYSVAGTDSIYFMVQILATKNPVKKDSPQFKGISSILEIMENDFYKYFTGKTNSFEEASESRKKLTEMGLPDAFVVAYQGDQRISIAKAVSLKN